MIIKIEYWDLSVYVLSFHTKMPPVNNTNVLQPLDTIMDLNIGTAFWFAARGSGYLREYTDDEVEKSFCFTDNNIPLLRVQEQENVKTSSVELLRAKEPMDVLSSHQSSADIRR